MIGRSAKTRVGTISLVGAGPGDPGLITVHGQTLLARADVVMHDRLVPLELLAACRPDAEIVDVGKLPGAAHVPQAEINALLVAYARAGRNVVRLKGGDPFVFGRGGEELAACRAAGVPCVVVPGVSSALAVPAAAGIPLTQRGMARSFAVITGHDSGAALPDYDFRALATLDTLVVLMGCGQLAPLVAALLDAGRAPDTPAAIIASGTTSAQRVIRATLATLAEAAAAADVQPPATTVIGATAALADAQLETWTSPVTVDTAWPPTAAAMPPRKAMPPRAAEDGAAECGVTAATLLAGRRVVLTQAPHATSELRRRLLERGATVLDCPLIDIRYPDATPALDAVLPELHTFDWITFTSVHGVRGFWRALTRAGRDARALHACRVAAVGPGTANELAEYGLRADLVPPTPSAEGLLAALLALSPAATASRANIVSRALDGLRVLVPHGSLALPTLPVGLRHAGAAVTTAIVYATEAATPTSAALENLRRGADAIVFCSPSAVLRFAALELDKEVRSGSEAPYAGEPHPLIACIGPTTGGVARRLGLTVGVEPARPGSAGLVDALVAQLAAREAAA